MFKNTFLTSIRNIAKNPGHAFVNIVGLAIGLAAAFLIMLWVGNELAYDRFHVDVNTIYKIYTHTESDGAIQTYDAAEVGIDLSSISEIEKSVRISHGTRWPHELCFRPEEKPTECVYQNGIYSDSTFFEVFNFPIVHGDKNPLTAPTNIAISEKMAKALYGDANPIGKEFKIDGHFPSKIAAVFQDAPANSSLQFDFVMPFGMFKGLRGFTQENFDNEFLSTYIKVHTQTTSDKLTALLNQSALTETLIEDGVSYQAFPFTEYRLNNRFENGKNAGGRIEYVNLFIIIALLVIVMACVNFINLIIARSSTRGKEIGIRKVTGANRFHLFWQFIGESFIIVMIASLLAIVLVQLLLPFFNLLTEERMSFDLLSKNVLPFLIGLIILVSVLSGIYPALVMSSFQPVNVLKNNIDNTGKSSTTLRKSLLTVQLAISIGIIIFSGALYHQLNFINAKNLGFDRTHIVRVEPTYKLLLGFEAFKNDLLANPKIRSVSSSSASLIEMNAMNNGVSWPGKPADQRTTFQTISCSPEFFETFKLELIQGNGFINLEADSLYNEVVITENAAFIMGLDEPIGEIISIGDASCIIKGVIKDFHSRSLREEMLPVIFWRADYKYTSTVFVSYNEATPSEALEIITNAYNKSEPSFTMKYWFLDDNFDALYKTEKIAQQLIFVFTIIALVISIMGIIGLATFNLLRRIKEIGIRRVFGATAIQVMSLLSKEFIGTLIFATVIAIPVSWYAASQWLDGFVYRVEIPVELYIFTFLAIALLTIGIICVKALGTVTTNPAEVLKDN